MDTSPGRARRTRAKRLHEDIEPERPQVTVLDSFCFLAHRTLPNPISLIKSVPCPRCVRTSTPPQPPPPATQRQLRERNARLYFAGKDVSSPCVSPVLSKCAVSVTFRTRTRVRAHLYHRRHYVQIPPRALVMPGSASPRCSVDVLGNAGVWRARRS